MPTRLWTSARNTPQPYTYIMITTAGRRDGGLSIIICQSITGNPMDSVRYQRVYRNNNYINTCINVNKLICINCCIVLRCCQTARLTMAAVVPTRSADVRRCMCVICLVVFSISRSSYLITSKQKSWFGDYAPTIDNTNQPCSTNIRNVVYSECLLKVRDSGHFSGERRLVNQRDR